MRDKSITEKSKKLRYYIYYDFSNFILGKYWLRDRCGNKHLFAVEGVNQGDCIDGDVIYTKHFEKYLAQFRKEDRQGFYHDICVCPTLKI